MENETQLEFDFLETPNTCTFTSNDSSTFGFYLADPSPMVLAIKPTCNMVFYSGSAEVGEFNWEDGIFKFTGDADESAKLFIEHLIKRYYEN